MKRLLRLLLERALVALTTTRGADMFALPSGARVGGEDWRDPVVLARFDRPAASRVRRVEREIPPFLMKDGPELPTLLRRQAQ